MAIERLPETNSTALEEFEDKVISDNSKAKKVMKTLFNNAGILVGVFIVFAVVVIVTTDVHLASFEEISALGLDFFLLLFCSYSMYVSCSDSGMRAGLGSKAYAEASTEYAKKKRYLIENDMQSGMYEFCRYYVANELKNARMSVLATAGFTYSEYTEKWMNMSKEDIEAQTDLTDPQKSVLIKTNKIKPIKLNPEQIIRKGNGEGRRAPIGINPKTKKRIDFGVKFVVTLLISGGIAIIALEFVKEPTWTIFASVILKLLTIVVNGFSGYKYGFENVVIDTVDYITDQTDILEQAINYITKSTNAHDADEGGTNTCAIATSESGFVALPEENTTPSLTMQTSPTSS